MSNEAAERLREYAAVGVDGWLRAPLYLIEEALAAERRAGADDERERIAKAVESASDGGSIYITRQRLQTVLDAYAEKRDSTWSEWKPLVLGPNEFNAGFGPAHVPAEKP